MKTTIKALLLCSIAILASCSTNVCKINGEVEDPQYEGMTVYLYNYEDATGGGSLDSAVVVNGKFSLKTEVDEPYIGILAAGSAMDNLQKWVIVEKGTVSVELDGDDLGGTKLNEVIGELFDDIDRFDTFQELHRLQVDYFSKTDPLEREALLKQYQDKTIEYGKKVAAYARNTFLNNSNNKAGLLALTEYLFDSYPDVDPKEAALLINQSCDMIKNNPLITRYLQDVAYAHNTLDGENFKDFTGTDFQTGQTTSLREMISGRVAVVDFWASWCSPCKKEISQYLIPLYKKYGKNPNFVIIGVDVSDTAANHAEAVADLGIEYPQLIDSDNVSGDLYGFRGIPYIIVIGADGKIAATDVRGNDIEVAVKNALGL